MTVRTLAIWALASFFFSLGGAQAKNPTWKVAVCQHRVQLAAGVFPDSLFTHLLVSRRLDNDDTEVDAVRGFQLVDGTLYIWASKTTTVSYRGSKRPNYTHYFYELKMADGATRLIAMETGVSAFFVERNRMYIAQYQVDTGRSMGKESIARYTFPSSDSDDFIMHDKEVYSRTTAGWVHTDNGQVTSQNAIVQFQVNSDKRTISLLRGAVDFSKQGLTSETPVKKTKRFGEEVHL
jgi:hypothetical protein